MTEAMFFREMTASKGSFSTQHDDHAHKPASCGCFKQCVTPTGGSFGSPHQGVSDFLKDTAQAVIRCFCFPDLFHSGLCRYHSGRRNSKHSTCQRPHPCPAQGIVIKAGLGGRWGGQK